MSSVRGSILIGCFLVATLGLWAAQGVHAAPSNDPVDFNIPAGNLTAALDRFAEQSGLQIVYDQPVSKTAQAKAINGHLSRRTALDQLLKGSGLAWSYVNDSTVVVRASKTKASDAAKRSAAADAEGPVAADVSVQSQRTALAWDPVANADIHRTIDDVQPYYIFDSQTIDQSGALNVEDFLKQRLTMDTTAQTSAQKIGGTGVGSLPQGQGNASAINLRGLGTDKTLVLINGRRMAGVTVGSTVQQPDINGIPLSAIDRIEVLPSSASGIYGGSALGGVINIILKKNYTGGDIGITYDSPFGADAPIRTAGGSYGAGFNGGRTQLLFNAQLSDSEPLYLQDRRQLFDRGLATILRNDPSYIYDSMFNPFLGSLPNIINGDDSTNLVFKNNGQPLGGQSIGSPITHVPAGTSPATPRATLNQGLLANAGSYNLDLPPTAQNPTGLRRQLSFTPTTKSWMASARQELSPNLDVTLDWARNENESSILAPQDDYTSYVRSGSPYNPFTSGVIVQIPIALTLPYQFKSFSDSLTVGLSAKLPRGWTGEADYSWSRNGLTTEAFHVDTLHLLGSTQNEFVDALRHPLNFNDRIEHDRSNAVSTLDDFAVRASGPFLSLPWGTPNLTVGLEHWRAATPDNVIDAIHSPVAISVQDDSTRFFYYSRKQDVNSGYAEASIPLVKKDWLPLIHSLDLQLSGRSQRYTVDSGTPGYSVDLTSGAVNYFSPTRPDNGQPFFATTNYKSTNGTIGLKYQPVPELILRASVASAFLPPTPEQLIKNPIPDIGTTTVLDPKNNNAQVTVQTISGGNPNVKPQNSKSRNAGLIWQPTWNPLQGLRLDLEYYKIDQFDAISNLDPQTIVSLYPGRVTRDASGRITLVDISALNLYKSETEGWDFNANYLLETSVGTFNLYVVESTILHLRTQYDLTRPEYDTVGFPSEGGAGKYKANATLTWKRKNWIAGWTARYFGSYKQYGAPGGNPFSVGDRTYLAPQGSDTIPSQTYHDLFLGYTYDKAPQGTAFGSELLSNVTVQFGVKNVFNTLPPFDVYYDLYISPYGDSRLRSFWLKVRKRF